MDDLTAKLSSMLSDPQSVEALKGMAQTLLSSPPAGDNTAQTASGSGDDLQLAVKLMTALKGLSADDDRTRLLTSLKPYLRDERRRRVDEAVRLLRLVSVLPAVTSSGLLGV